VEKSNKYYIFYVCVYQLDKKKATDICKLMLKTNNGPIRLRTKNYGETWKTTNQITRRLQMFVNKCLGRIINVKWTDKITNEELWRITHQKSIENQIKRRKWNGIEHTLRKVTGEIEKTALDWNPQGYRRMR